MIDEADASAWLSRENISLTVQTLHQQEGYSTTLLRMIEVPDDGADDVYERFSQFDRR